MTDVISKTAEDEFGIRSDPSDIERLRLYIFKKYGALNPETIKKVFISGEAASFLTVNETYFFREPVHFSFLKNILSTYEEAEIQICSAASSTGCEAYSIAMLIEEFNRTSTKPLFYHIDAFDINQEVIKTALQGVYTERVMRDDGSSFHYMTKPFLKKIKYGYEINASLKKNIRFFTHNLMDALYQEVYHIIFFRNAFIYFSQRARTQVLSNLSSALKENGFLIMGVSETAGAHHENLEPKNKNDVFYFQKTTPKKPAFDFTL